MDEHIRTPEQGFKGEGRAGITGGLGADGRTDQVPVPVQATMIYLIFCSTYGIIESKSKLVILYKFLFQ